jgi:tetratricopeptide (TPR) repeat protein
MFPNNSMKKILLFLIVLLFHFYHSQVYTLAELDSLTLKYSSEENFKDAVKLNIAALSGYKINNNTEGIFTSYTNIASQLCSVGQYKDALKYLDKAKTDVKRIKNNALLARFYNEYGRNYCFLGLYEQSNKNFDTAIHAAQKVSDPKRKIELLYISYSWKWANFDELNVKDSVYSIKKKTLRLMPNEPLIYVKIAYQYIKEKKHLDSAEYYLNKALPLTFNNEQKGFTMYVYGELFILRGKNEKALDYYLKSLTFFQKRKNKGMEMDSYKRISETYMALDDLENSDLYLKKYSALSDKLQEKKKKELNIAVEKIIQEKKEEERKKEKNLYVLIFILVIVTLFLFYFIRKTYLKKQQTKDQLIEKKDELLEKKEELLEKKSQETHQLKKKVNASFNTLVQMAKNNDPFFLKRFKEVYPEFYKKLISDHPNLKEYDIKFCAYLRLNLTNKEIVQYENVSMRTIETRKYRLKKKLNLPADIDLTKWILEL